jgi:hypothetical protein
VWGKVNGETLSQLTWGVGGGLSLLALHAVSPSGLVVVGRLGLEELRRYVDQGYRVRVKQVSGGMYVVLRGRNGVERGAGPLNGYNPGMQALIRCLASKASWRECASKLDEGSVEHEVRGASSKQQAGQQAAQRQGPNVRVEGGRIIVEREVELETIWDVKRIALDPRVYILYAYAQRYLGYTGSLGEFLSDCTILFFRERGIEVTLRTP